MNIFLQLALIAVGSGLAAWIVIWAVIAYFNHRKFQVEAAARHLDAFYAAAQKFVKDESVPDALAEFLGFISKDVGTPRAAWRVTKLVCSADFMNGTNHREDCDATFEKLTADQLNLLIEAYSESVKASMYSDIFLSWFHDGMRESAKQIKQEKEQLGKRDLAVKRPVNNIKPPLSEKTLKHVGLSYGRFQKMQMAIAA